MPLDAVANAIDEGQYEMKTRPQGFGIAAKPFQRVLKTLPYNDHRRTYDGDAQNGDDYGPNHRVFKHGLSPCKCVIACCTIALFCPGSNPNCVQEEPGLYRVQTGTTEYFYCNQHSRKQPLSNAPEVTNGALPKPYPEHPVSERDRLFEQQPDGMSDFVFDERVVRVFPDMIKRSVPGYGLILPMLGVLARRHVQTGSHVYDLGCSLGAVSRVIQQSVAVPEVRIFAVDNSHEMLKRLEADLEAKQNRHSSLESELPATKLPEIELVLGDIATTPISNASLSVLNFTLQFIGREQREALLRRIAEGTRPGGALVLSEKIRFSDAAEQQLQTNWHHDFKRAQGYSDLEIARKRDALERVMLPDTEDQHLARLQQAGWSKTVRWYQCFNFVSYLAIR